MTSPEYDALAARIGRVESSLRAVRDDLNALIADIDYRREGEDEPTVDAEYGKEAEE